MWRSKRRLLNPAHNIITAHIYVFHWCWFCEELFTPGKINMEPKNTPLEKEIHIFQTIISRFYVNLSGGVSHFKIATFGLWIFGICLGMCQGSEIPMPPCERPFWSEKLHGEWNVWANQKGILKFIYICHPKSRFRTGILIISQISSRVGEKKYSYILIFFTKKKIQLELCKEVFPSPHWKMDVSENSGTPNHPI